jgi:hypothetical protein
MRRFIDLERSPLSIDEEFEVIASTRRQRSLPPRGRRTLRDRNGNISIVRALAAGGRCRAAPTLVAATSALRRQPGHLARSGVALHSARRRDGGGE